MSITPQELRSSAERMFEWASRHCADEGLRASTRTAIGDTYCVSQAWLADHPEDDSEHVDEAWLQRVGFVGDEHNSIFENGEACVCLDTRGQWALYIDGCCGPHPLTRRSVRLLCEALGVKLETA